MCKRNLYDEFDAFLNEHKDAKLPPLPDCSNISGEEAENLVKTSDMLRAYRDETDPDSGSPIKGLFGRINEKFQRGVDATYKTIDEKRREHGLPPVERIPIGLVFTGNKKVCNPRVVDVPDFTPTKL